MSLARSALRPSAQPSYISTLGGPAKCPKCRLSTRSHPFFSSGRIHIQSSRVTSEAQRPDNLARIEYFGPDGIVERRIRAPCFREYASMHERYNPTVPVTIPALLETYRDMHSRGETPTAEAYLALLRAAAEYSTQRRGAGGDEAERLVRERGDGQAGFDLWQEHGEVGLGWKVAWCAWRDAWEGGIDLGIRGFDLLLKTAQPHPEITSALLAQLPHLSALSATLTEYTYNALLSGPLAARSLPRVLAIYTEMRRRALPLANPAVLRRIVEVALEWGCPKVALDVAEYAEQTGVRGVDQAVWADILRCSAEGQYLEGVRKTWERVIEHRGFVPEEGLIILVLNVAGRHGDPDLATRALACLARLDVEPREHHLAPLLDAFCAAGKLADAFEVLDLLRHTADIAPGLKTAESLVRCMGTTGIVDEAFFTLGKIKETGKRIDVVAFNSVIAACERLGDLGRALAVYRDASTLGVTPDADTYNCLLGICVAKGAKEQGDIILREMKAAKPKIPLDERTYDHLIRLALTQPEYDQAFVHLEAMKEKGLRPPLEIYERLVLKCVSNGDVRWKTVLGEMRNGGYKVSPKLIETVQIRAGIIPAPPGYRPWLDRGIEGYFNQKEGQDGRGRRGRGARGTGKTQARSA